MVVIYIYIINSSVQNWHYGRAVKARDSNSLSGSDLLGFSRAGSSPADVVLSF